MTGVQSCQPEIETIILSTIEASRSPGIYGVSAAHRMNVDLAKNAADQIKGLLHAEPTVAQIDAALNAWFSVKPSASESDAVLERSMKAALIAGASMVSLEDQK